jgi:hypothetical protein
VSRVTDFERLRTSGPSRAGRQNRQPPIKAVLKKIRLWKKSLTFGKKISIFKGLQQMLSLRSPNPNPSSNQKKCGGKNEKRPDSDFVGFGASLHGIISMGDY